MKSESKIRRMLAAIRLGQQRGEIAQREGTAQEIVLAWVLDALPPDLEAFQNATGKSKFERAMAHTGIVTSDEELDAAIAGAARESASEEKARTP